MDKKKDFKDYTLEGVVSLVSENERFRNKLNQGRIDFRLVTPFVDANDKGELVMDNQFSVDAFSFMQSCVSFPMRNYLIAKSKGGKIIPYDALCYLFGGAKITVKRTAKSKGELNSIGQAYSEDTFHSEIVSIVRDYELTAEEKADAKEMINDAVKAYEEKMKQMPLVPKL